MKKYTVLLFILVTVLLLAGCSKGNKNLTATVPAATEESEQEEPSRAVEDSTAAPAVSDATLPETVLVDEEGIKVTATGIDKDALFGTEIFLLIENNTDQALIFQSERVSVNGYMVESIMSSEVAAGKKANDTLTLIDSDMEASGIDTIDEIELYLHVFNVDTWEDYYNSSAITLKTSDADSHTQTYDDSGELIYEGNGIKIVAKNLEANELLGQSLFVYLENNGSQAVIVQTRDVSVNGFMMDSVFSVDILPGKRAVNSILFLNDDLEKNGIETIEEIELSLCILDFNTWDILFETRPIKITF